MPPPVQQQVDLTVKFINSNSHATIYHRKNRRVTQVKETGLCLRNGNTQHTLKDDSYWTVPKVDNDFDSEIATPQQIEDIVMFNFKTGKVEKSSLNSTGRVRLMRIELLWE
ncbi:hypothetical protein DFO77_10785 [Marinilabilia salmonicolor]|uniref:Uncharacterized protein n=1 Tax=Marinilabilia salmonicolor TaxID=989 RepID=A0A368VAV7_9BACT|nr:hypothetical protein DFO77_10785 [Marinilabilia salmonicolor]